MSVNFQDIEGWVVTAKSTLELLKSGAALMPKGAKRAEMESAIKRAEDNLQNSNAKIAKELGYQLCQCTFPPQIMLWKEGEGAHVCENAACGRKKYAGMRISKEALELAQQPRGPHSWMGR